IGILQLADCYPSHFRLRPLQQVHCPYVIFLDITDVFRSSPLQYYLNIYNITDLLEPLARLARAKSMSMTPPRARHGRNEWKKALELDSSSEPEQGKDTLHVTSRRIGLRGSKGSPGKSTFSERKEAEPSSSSRQAARTQHYR